MFTPREITDTIRGHLAAGGSLRALAKMPTLWAATYPGAMRVRRAARLLCFLRGLATRPG